jgi:hypothetical protein
LSYGYSTNKVDLATDKVNNNENAAFKIKTTKKLFRPIEGFLGADYFVTQFKEDFKENSGSIFTNGYDSNIMAIPKLIYYSLKVGGKSCTGLIMIC